MRVAITRNTTAIIVAVIVVIILVSYSAFSILVPVTSSSTSTSSMTTSSSLPVTVTSTTGSVTSSSTGTTSTISTGYSASATSSSSSTSSVITTSYTGNNDYYFLAFMQKGVVELISPTSGDMLGYLRLFNISDSVSVQTSTWEMYPVQGATAQNVVFPLTNGTFIVTDTSQLNVESRLNLGTTVGYTGVAVSPDEKTAVLVDGSSGTIELLNLTSLQTVWKETLDTSAGTSAYPSDARWSPDGSTVVVPLLDNDSIDVLSAQTGQVEQETSLNSGSPAMLAISGQGDTLAVELSNNTDLFYSYPALKLLGSVSFAGSSMSPASGVFTPDGQYYIEGSGTSNSVAVISLSDFKVVNTINLPQSSAPGLANMQITPDGNYVYVNQPGNPATGGIIYMFSLSNIATADGATISVPMTTAPSFVIPISMTLGNYLADNILLPPVTGLHC